MEGKNKIIIYADWWNQIKELTDEQAGKLFKLIMGYVNDEHPEKNLPQGDLMRLLFIPYQSALDRDLATYKAKCEKNRENVNKRWNTNENESIQSNTNAYERKNRNTNYTDKDNDKDNDNDNDNDILSLHSRIDARAREKGLSDDDISFIQKYVEDNEIKEIKYLDAFITNYVEHHKKDDNPLWLKKYLANINDGMEELGPEWLKEYTETLPNRVRKL